MNEKKCVSFKTDDQVIVEEMFMQTGGMLLGHFTLSSGLHSSRYLQCMKVLQHPTKASLLGEKLAIRFDHEKIDVVLSPALGGIIIGYEVARHLFVRSIFAERKDRKLTLRRGHELNAGDRVLIIEDVITTGGSVKELVDLVEATGCVVVGIASIVDRSGGVIVDEKIPQTSLLHIDIENYEPEKCPLCKEGVPITKPGSKGA
jgi:orotate phosphoribosyltransferase